MALADEQPGPSTAKRPKTDQLEGQRFTAKQAADFIHSGYFEDDDLISDDSIENEDGGDFGDDRATTVDLDIARLIQRSAESEREYRAEAESDWQPPSEDDTDWQPPSEGDADGEGGDTDGEREGNTDEDGDTDGERESDTDGEDGDTVGETDGDTASMNTSDTEEPALPNINNWGRTRGRGRGRGQGVQASSCTRGGGGGGEVEGERQGRRASD